MIPRTHRLSSGFTLIELLIVVVIISLLTVAALPTVIAALSEREILDASSLLQTSLLAARDTAARSGNASGIRLLLDPDRSYSAGPNNTKVLNINGVMAADRLVAITQAPDYGSGTVRVHELVDVVTINSVQLPVQQIVVCENKWLINPVTGAYDNPLRPISPNYQPTDWYRNIRQGETVRLNQSSRPYRIAGPMIRPNNSVDQNPDRYLISDRAGTPAVSLPINLLSQSYPGNVYPPQIYYNASYPNVYSRYINLSGSEYMFVTNGLDDDGDGFIDEQCDGIDNNNDLIIDPGYNNIDDDGDGVVDNIEEIFWVGRGVGYSNPALAEYEPESLDSTLRSRMDILLGGSSFQDGMSYTIQRRAVVAPNAKEVMLPSTIVVDLTTGTFDIPERSRLPFDPIAGTVDILFEVNGRVQEETVGVNVPMRDRNLPFYHFWLASKDDLFAPLATNPQVSPALPTSLTSTANGGPLKKERRLLTLFTKTGNTVINSIENFSPTNVELPYLEAQAGTREP